MKDYAEIIPDSSSGAVPGIVEAANALKLEIEAMLKDVKAPSSKPEQP